jgi:hypothetical protein
VTTYVWFEEVSTYSQTAISRLHGYFEEVRAFAQSFSTRISRDDRSVLQYLVQWLHLLNPALELVRRPERRHLSQAVRRSDRAPHAGHEDYG